MAQWINAPGFNPQYVLVKGKIQQDDIMIVIIYAPNVSAPNCIKILIDINSKKDPNILILGDLNTPISPTGRS